MKFISENYTRPDGAEVKISHVECQDCKFISGLIYIKFPNGISLERTGAGCFARPRRDPEEARKWADKILMPSME